VAWLTRASPDEPKTRWRRSCQAWASGRRASGWVVSLEWEMWVRMSSARVGSCGGGAGEVSDEDEDEEWGAGARREWWSGDVQGRWP